MEPQPQTQSTPKVSPPPGWMALMIKSSEANREFCQKALLDVQDKKQRIIEEMEEGEEKKRKLDKKNKVIAGKLDDLIKSVHSCQQLYKAEAEDNCDIKKCHKELRKIIEDFKERHENELEDESNPENDALEIMEKSLKDAVKMVKRSLKRAAEDEDGGPAPKEVKPKKSKRHDW